MLRVLGRIWTLIALGVVLTTAQARAADILLDEPVRLRDVICFPARADTKKFYYAPVKARLSAHPSGKPQFSFLRWVDNVSSEPGAEDIGEGIGGGIVHALVRLGLTDEEVAEARKELERLKPGATLEGPVIFNSGTFALITSFKPENAELVRQLVGVGEAPIIEGTQAAISLTLTKKGAEVLWESFHTATPDISFLFTLELDGFRSPKQATLEADFEEVYKHESFHEDLQISALAEAGAAIPVDEIVQGVALASGAPIPPGVLPNLDVGIKARAGGYLQSEVDRVFDDLRESGAIRITFVGEDKELQAIIDGAYTHLRDVIFSPAKRITGNTSAAVQGRGDPASVEATERRPRKEKKGKAPSKTVQGKQEEGPTRPETARAEPPKDAQAASVDSGAKTNDASAKSEKTAEQAFKGMFEKEQPKLSTPSPVKPKAGKCAGYEAGDSFSGLAQISLALDACLTTKYQFKDQRHRGKYSLDLRKYTASTLRVPFAENIGDLRAHLADAAVFRSVNLDDPLYRQREIAASLNEITLDDFGKVLNSVAVQLRKRHASGAETLREVRIDRAVFARKGNDHKLLYGWNGDDDRGLWLEYDYRVLWSFVGGHQVETPWQTGKFSVINLDPPFTRRLLQLEGSPERLQASGARLVTVRLIRSLAGSERIDQVTLRADQGDLSRRVELLSSTGEVAYDYEIEWRFAGGRKVSSGRQSSTQDVLFVDEIPN